LEGASTKTRSAHREKHGGKSIRLPVIHGAALGKRESERGFESFEVGGARRGTSKKRMFDRAHKDWKKEFEREH